MTGFTGVLLGVAGSVTVFCLWKTYQSIVGLNKTLGNFDGQTFQNIQQQIMAMRAEHQASSQSLSYISTALFGSGGLSSFGSRGAFSDQTQTEVDRIAGLKYGPPIPTASAADLASSSAFFGYDEAAAERAEVVRAAVKAGISAQTAEANLRQQEENDQP